MLHNEVTLIGRLRNRGLREKVNNQDSLCLIISCPNDEDYNLNPNNIAVHYITNSYKMFYGLIGQSFVVNGHMDNRRRVIADYIYLLKNNSESNQ